MSKTSVKFKLEIDEVTDILQINVEGKFYEVLALLGTSCRQVPQVFEILEEFVQEWPGIRDAVDAKTSIKPRKETTKN